MELSALLTTIAASSASFVAILGGFIASKLISINGERETVLTRLSELHEQENLKQEEMLKLKSEIDEDDALDFIRSHSEQLVNLSNLDEAYESNKQQYLAIEELQPYWTKAVEVYNTFCDAVNKGAEFNEDDIPNALAIEYSENPFEYDVCCIIAKELSPPPFGIDISNIATVTGAWYERNKRLIQELSLEIRCIQIEEKQLNLRMSELCAPKGMKSGLIIISLFSICNIILPLIFSTMVFESAYIYNTVRTTFISLLSIGLLATFTYLALLLRWKKR